MVVVVVVVAGFAGVLLSGWIWTVFLRRHCYDLYVTFRCWYLRFVLTLLQERQSRSRLRPPEFWLLWVIASKWWIRGKKPGIKSCRRKWIKERKSKNFTNRSFAPSLAHLIVLPAVLSFVLLKYVYVCTCLHIFSPCHIFPCSSVAKKSQKRRLIAGVFRFLVSYARQITRIS